MAQEIGKDPSELRRFLPTLYQPQERDLEVDQRKKRPDFSQSQKDFEEAVEVPQDTVEVGGDRVAISPSQTFDLSATDLGFDDSSSDRGFDERAGRGPFPPNSSQEAVASAYLSNTQEQLSVGAGRNLVNILA